MIITHRLESLLKKLAHSAEQSASAKNINAAHVRDIIENGQYLIAPAYAGMYNFPAKNVTVAYGGETHQVQVDPTNVHPHLFCVDCDTHGCDYAAAALLIVIVDSEGHRNNENCPHSGQVIPDKVSYEVSA